MRVWRVYARTGSSLLPSAPVRRPSIKEVPTPRGNSTPHPHRGRELAGCAPAQPGLLEAPRQQGEEVKGRVQVDEQGDWPDTPGYQAVSTVVVSPTASLLHAALFFPPNLSAAHKPDRGKGEGSQW